MKMFRRISMLICAVSVMTLLSVTVLAARFPDFAYRVRKNEVDVVSYTNSAVQTDYNVTVSTKPDSVNGVVQVKISSINDFSNSEAIASQTFPGSFEVPPIQFVLPAGKAYYAFVYTYLEDYVSGILEATY